MRLYYEGNRFVLVATNENYLWDIIFACFLNFLADGEGLPHHQLVRGDHNVIVGNPAREDIIKNPVVKEVTILDRELITKPAI